MKLLQVDNLSKTYPGEKSPALRDLSLEVPEHSVFGFLGPNGAGKTTSIKILTGLMQPSSGEIRLKGELMGRRNRKLRGRLGYLSQEPRYYPWMTGIELLEMVAGLFGVPEGESKNRIRELLELTGLWEERRRRIDTYSGGMVQRLGIAQALVGGPEILFLDEPVSALDPIGRKELLDLISRLKERTTVFMSTHILADVERVCDQVGILKNGRLIALETIAGIHEKYSPSRKELVFGDAEDCRAVSVWLRDRSVGLVEPHTDGGVRDHNGTKVVIMTGADYDRICTRLFEYLGERRIGLVEIRDRRADLEEIFIQLVGEHVVEEHVTGGHDE